MAKQSYGWGKCPQCFCERKLDKAGFMVAHNRWSRYASAMIPCEGTSCWPDRSNDGDREPERV